MSSAGCCATKAPSMNGTTTRPATSTIPATAPSTSITPMRRPSGRSRNMGISTPSSARRPDSLHHVVAVAVDRASRPIRLFTVNRWVTQERWIEAAGIVALLDRFVLDGARPSRWVNRWLGALLRLFRPQIVDLLHQRDAALAAWQSQHAGRDALEATELEVLSEMPVSAEAQLDAVA